MFSLHTRLSTNGHQPTKQPATVIRVAFVCFSVTYLYNYSATFSLPRDNWIQATQHQTMGCTRPGLRWLRVIRAFLQESGPHRKHKLARGRERGREREVIHLTTLQLLRLFCKASMVDECCIKYEAFVELYREGRPKYPLQGQSVHHTSLVDWRGMEPGPAQREVWFFALEPSLNLPWYQRFKTYNSEGLI